MMQRFVHAIVTLAYWAGCGWRSCMRWAAFLARVTIVHNLGRSLTFVVGIMTMAAAFRWLDEFGSFGAAIGVGGVLAGVSGMAPWLRRVKFPGGELEMRDPPGTAEQYQQMADRKDAGKRTIFPDEQMDTTRQLVAEKAAQALFDDAVEDYFDGCQFQFFMYNDRQQKLIAVLRPDSPSDPQRGWKPGEGATGMAYQKGIYQLIQGSKTHDGTFGLEDERRHRYSHPTEVAAMPVLNASDRLIGVLSVSHSQDRVILGTDEGYRRHVAIASAMSRIVVDLLGWRTDESQVDL